MLAVTYLLPLGHAMLAPARPPPPRLLRTGPAVASANEDMTIGDLLAGYLTRELRNLPEKEQIERAQRSLDMLLETGAEDLESVRRQLGKGLLSSASITLHKLNEQLGTTEEVYSKRLNSRTEAIDSALAPSREALRAELEWHLAEQAARQAARQRAIESRRGFKRSFTWRNPSGTALSRAAGLPKHPVVKVCEASSFLVSLILLLALGDVVSRLHILDAHYGYQPQAHHAQQFEARHSPMDFSPPASVVFPPAALAREAYRPAPAPRSTYQQGTLPLGIARPNWWLAMRVPLAVYLASLGVIVMRSGTDEWAALAIGIVPDDNVSPLGGAGYVRFEYDWEKDEWV